MTPRARFPRWALIVPAVLAVAAIGWMLIGIPAVVKYPDDLDVAPRYEGTFTLFVDPATAAPLDAPVELPLTVDRRIEVDREQTGASRAVVVETIDQQVGDLFATTQTNVYVMDRSTMQNVDDPRAYAFAPDNVVDRSPAYRLNLPFDVDPDDTHEIYKNEIAGTYRMTGTGESAEEVGGLSLTPFAALPTEAPMDDAYFDELNAVVPLPRELTFDQLRPHLLAAGIDVDVVLAALAPVLTPAELDALVTATGEPIGLDYVVGFEGSAGVDRTTGAEVRVGATESIGARPDLAGTDALREVLAAHPEVPEAVAALEDLDALVSGPPVALFSYSYAQTDESVLEVAAVVSDLRDQVALARVLVPAALLGLGAIVLAAGALAWRVRRRRDETPSTSPPTLDLSDDQPDRDIPDVAATTRGPKEDRRA